MNIVTKNIYSHGLLAYTTSYRNRKRHGKHIIYWANSQNNQSIYSTEMYKNGVLHGEAIKYRESGDACLFQYYIEGKLVYSYEPQYDEYHLYERNNLGSLNTKIITTNWANKNFIESSLNVSGRAAGKYRRYEKSISMDTDGNIIELLYSIRKRNGGIIDRFRKWGYAAVGYYYDMMPNNTIVRLDKYGFRNR